VDVDVDADVVVVVSLVRRLACRDGCLGFAEWEKNKGDVGPSGRSVFLRPPSVGAGMSTIPGGDAPVRAFLTGDGSMVLSGTVCLDEDLLPWLRVRLSSDGLRRFCNELDTGS
jgi:hypothetical protein